MTFTAHINVMPLKELLDPQGKAVMSGLKNLGMGQVQDVRIGKHITLQIEAASKEEAHQIAESACQKLLANQVMEYFEVQIQ
ncbi:phosphoribosylformylglycinamidine synthase subunit PurS [Chitinophaga varians]|uniref:Phosphoribosylformylglycinamidine synthase subunit PurS n=4 Tax=Chitinophaga TaxID=79328 RepID=A0AAE7DBE7_9BACT|nr:MULTISPECIES: phosphoribosylformylglycinamidine synthase subunit PurS [Chitinophaga]NLR64021.1 phosphoribosylformylglycinamidine synthase subunit PurS [Chitinophaga varians]NML37111.1 phosphoribosylformylglycinamidine synthase subunit PurS [Chitinophaga fulva]QJB35344.1 phosphoribosylformylglycinamidine synthase subunit PurS [Chitinophaga oryzae]QJB41880.1 phosphoribosylformylglycinamidine synthase subunit PurS [Chitinophaga oryzae]SKA00126.1 phosphoribosylformylglycinamidine synthase [Chit